MNNRPDTPCWGCVLVSCRMLCRKWQAGMVCHVLMPHSMLGCLWFMLALHQ